MEQITVAVLTLLALYILYSECIKLPMIIKQNKKLCYLVIGGIFLYCCANRNVEGNSNTDQSKVGWVVAVVMAGFIGALWAISKVGGDSTGEGEWSSSAPPRRR